MRSARGTLPRAVLAAIAAVVAASSAGTAIAASTSSAGSSSVPPGFVASALAVLSDADMVATAYTDGRLGPAAGHDRLSLVRTRGARAGTVAGADVSDSVVAQPAAVAVSPDGRLAVAAETTGPRSARTATLAQLPDGSRLTLTSLVGGTPRVLQVLRFPAHPETVDFSPDGRTLAVTFGPKEMRRLALVPVERGRLGAPVYVGLPGVRLPAAATRTAQVDWHPSSQFLGVSVPSLGVEAFFRVAPDRRSILPWGPPVEVGDNPFMGRFTPDGRHFVVTNTAWNLGSDAPVGTVAVTRFDDEDPARTRLVSRAPASYGPEGLTISPDGRKVITSNIEFSANRVGDPYRTEYTSLSLFTLDPASGRLVHAHTVYSDAVLTESAAIDTTGTWLASTAFQRRADPAHGSVDFWRIVDDRNSQGPKLVATSYSVTLPRGPHSMVLIP